MKPSDAAVGMLVVTPMGHIGRIRMIGSYRAWVDYLGRDAHLQGVELDPRLLRLANQRELLAAGIASEA